ncbi:MAG: serine hydrolase [Firmicutes bacterium]|nr:serine hydrolase [Bacillota bacterium]
MNKTQVTIFEQFAEDIKKQYEAVGIAVSVFDKDKVLYRKNFGVRDLETGAPIDDDTIFGCASISKSFTALSVMQLAEEGKVDINAPLSKYIPEFKDPQDEPVLVRHLLSHAGGFFPLPRILVEHVATDMGIWNGGKDELGLNEAMAAEGAKRVAERLSAQTRFTGKPGQRMSYCNDGFGLLSEIVRREGDQPSFSEYVKKHILDPLGMSRSCAEFIAPIKDPNHASLYKHVGGKLTGGWDFYDNAFVLNGGGAMKSTIHDLTEYVRMYMNAGKPIANKRIVEEMYRPRQHYRFHCWYGYGVCTINVDDFTVNQHGGSLTGVSSHFGWSPELGVGVVVFCNTSGVPVAEISNAAFRMAAGHDPLPRPCALRCEWDEKTCKAVCGTFTSGEGSAVEISYEDGKLEIKTGGKPVSFCTAAPDTVIVRGPFRESDAIFLSDDEGKVWGLRFGGRILPRTK